MRFDLSHRHLYVNRAVESLTGISQAKFIGKTHQELGFPSDLCDFWGEKIDQVVNTKISLRTEFTLPEGTIMDWTLVPEFDDSKQVISVMTIARDITENKSANVKLLDNEKRFKDAFKLAILATWEIDVLNKQVILNEEFCLVIGLDYEGEGHLLDSSVYFDKWVHDEDKDNFNKLFYQAVKSQDENYEGILEYRINKPNKEAIWLHATIRLSLNKDGVVLSAYGTCQDITQTKRTELELEAHRLHLEELVEQRTEALKKSEDKLKDAIQLARLSTWEFDLLNEDLRVEGTLEKKLSPDLYARENVIQFEQFVDVIDPRDFKLWYTSFEKASKTNEIDYLDFISYRMFDQYGNTRNLNLTIKVLIGQNGVERLYGTIQDITHIISSKTENERLTGIIEATSDIVGIFDADRNLVYLNKAGKDFYGERGQELSQKNTLVNQHDICKGLLKEEVRVEVEEKGYWMGENFLIRHDNKEVPFSQIMIAHYLDNGDLDCYSTIIRDISQLKETEEHLKYKNNELDTFVYRVSHDMRGPVASMMGLYNVVKHEVLDETSLAFFEMYNDQIIRLNETILALIDLTRIKEKTAEYDTISFEEIVDGSINSFTHLLGFESTKIEKIYKLHRVYNGDKTLLTTIIQNLIENAIKYSRPEVDNVVQVLIELPTDKDFLTINVTDNGRGIKKAVQGDVFNMFFRGDDNSAIGSGLGLYILKNAVDKLNGKINLDSVVNEGTSFTITIPL